MMSEIGLAEGSAEYLLIQSFLAGIEGITDFGVKVNLLTKEERDRKIIDLSRPYLQWQSEDSKATRPIAFLDKYLKGDDTSENIDLFSLLSEDKGVRVSVHTQIRQFLSQREFFKATGIDLSTSQRMVNARSIGVDPLNYRQKLTKFQSKELTIDIPQNKFKINDWKNAIGSFKLNWLPIELRSNRKVSFVRLWGENLYQWHPQATERKSVAIHKAAERLKEFGAKDFKMIFQPCLMSVSSGEVFRLSDGL